MEDLQSALQGILSDPEQMARIAAMAESLGLKPPEASPLPQAEEAAPPDPTGGLGLDPNLVRLLGQLGTAGGREVRILGALRSSLAPAGQAKADRALRAAKLSRLASQLLKARGEGHV